VASFNRIIFVGYLGRDPELRYTGQGTPVCNFSIATTEKRRDLAGEPREHTTWFHVTAWNRQAELANQYLVKGSQIYLEGRLRLEQWTDRDGARRTSLKVTATDVRFLGPRRERLDDQADEDEDAGLEDGETPF
jgi:single-strand DNA-binding protein